MDKLKDDFNYKVSVIVPVYNKEKYVEYCVKTIRSQSLSDIEIICVDDGSTDASASIIERLAKNDQRVKLLKQNNQGAGPARNAGIDVATGEYIAFMDPDDWYPDDNVLRDLYQAAIEADANICGGSLFEYVSGDLRKQYSGSKQKYVFEKTGYVKYSDYQFDYGYHRFIYRKSFLDQHALRFPPYRRFQDPPFFVKAMVDAQQFWAMPRPSYIYRVAYKEVGWNLEKLNDLAKGLLDVIRIAAQYGLSTLCALEMSRIESSYMALFYKAMEWDSIEDCYIESLRKLQAAVAFLPDIPLSSEVCLALTALLNSLSIRFESKSDSINDFSSRAQGPAVSVIVPVYNVESYLEQCLLSVLGQTLDAIEVIAVNDGSTDNSGAILDRLARKDARLRVVTKENGGLSSARNKGVEYATGEYIQFLDSDDLLAPQTLEMLYKKAKQDNLDQLFFSGSSFFETYGSYKGSKSYLTYYDYTDKNYGIPKAGQEFFAEVSANGEYKPSACFQLIKKSFLANNGIGFMDGLLHEDNLFTLQCLICSARTAAVQDKYYYRRVHEDSIMTNAKGAENAFGYYIAADRAIRFAADNNIDLLDEFKSELINRNRALLVQATKWFSLAEETSVSRFTSTLTATDEVLFSSVMAMGKHFYELFQKQNKENKNYRTTIKNQEHALGKQKRMNRSLQKEIGVLRKKIRSLKASNSWKVGRGITFPIRAIKKNTRR